MQLKVHNIYNSSAQLIQKKYIVTTLIKTLNLIVKVVKCKRKSAFCGIESEYKCKSAFCVIESAWYIQKKCIASKIAPDNSQQCPKPLMMLK